MSTYLSSFLQKYICLLSPTLSHEKGKFSIICSSIFSFSIFLQQTEDEDVFPLFLLAKEQEKTQGTRHVLDWSSILIFFYYSAPPPAYS